MTSTLVNLTLLRLNEELENFSDIYTDPTYQRTLKDPELRLKLIAYVLNRVPNRHIAVNPENASSISSEFLVSSTEESLKLENLIHQGIFELNQERNKRDFYPAYQTANTTYYPLNCFI